MYKEDFCGIYKITSPSNKIYIGQSIRMCFRFWQHKQLHYEKPTKLQYSFLKHGVENHIFEIIHICDQEELNYFEKKYIKDFESFNTPHGLNLTEGGDSYKVSDETKEMQSKYWKEFYKNNKEAYNKLVAQVTAIDKRGDKNGRYGTGIRICQFDLRGNFIKEHISVCDATNEIGVKSTARIYYCCYRKISCKTANGFIWRFKDDCIVENGILKEKIISRSIKSNKKIPFRGVTKINDNSYSSSFYDTETKNRTNIGCYNTIEDAVRARNIFIRDQYGIQEPDYNIDNPFKIPIRRNKIMSDKGKSVMKEKLSNRFSGEKNPRFGIKLDNDLKNKIREGNRKSEKVKRIPIIQLSLNGDFIKEFRGSGDAVFEIGWTDTAKSKIIECLKKRKKTYKGFIWVYKSEYESLKLAS